MKKITFLFLLFIFSNCSSDFEADNRVASKSAVHPDEPFPATTLYTIGVNDENSNLSLYLISGANGELDSRNRVIQFYNWNSQSPQAFPVDLGNLQNYQKNSLFDVCGFPFTFLDTYYQLPSHAEATGVPQNFRFNAYGLFRFPLNSGTPFNDYDTRVVYLNIGFYAVNAVIGPKINFISGSANSITSLSKNTYRVNSTSYFDGALQNGGNLYGVNKAVLLNPFSNPVIGNNYQLPLLLPAKTLNISLVGDPTSLTIIKENNFMLFGSRQEVTTQNNLTYHDYRIVQHSLVNTTFYNRGIKKDMANNGSGDEAVRVASNFVDGNFNAFTLATSYQTSGRNRYSVFRLKFNPNTNNYSTFLINPFVNYTYLGIQYNLFAPAHTYVRKNGVLVENYNYFFGDIIMKD